MQIWMFRHGEKENLGALNPSLSSQGWQQAKKLRDEVMSGNLVRPQKLLASPKIRALQSFEPLSQALGMTVQALDLLDERANAENRRHFTDRVSEFLQMFNGSQEVVYFVTHLDWIEEALLQMGSESPMNDYAWSPFQYLASELNQNSWKTLKAGVIVP